MCEYLESLGASLWEGHWTYKRSGIILMWTPDTGDLMVTSDPSFIVLPGPWTPERFQLLMESLWYVH